jgi:type IV secretory pathway TraG/TraD family ATPase VirD4
LQHGVHRYQRRLANLTSFTDVHKTAQLLVNSSIKDSDGFWNEGAVRIIRVIIQCLINRGDLDYINLHNVKFLLNSFDVHVTAPGKSQFDRFVVESTLDDPSTYHDYKGFTNGNEKTMLSFLSTADTALAALGNPEIARLTTENQFDFTALKQRKIALFVIVNQKDMGFYSFLLNLFYTDLFNRLISDLNTSKNPVYLLLDEFGHLTIPDFEVFATTARKYKVGFFVFLQSFSQLVSRYGPHNASTILNGLQTEIYLPGIGLDAAQELQRKLGKVYSQSGANAHEQARNLMDEADLIRLESDTALLLHANKKPVKLSTKPYFKQRRFARFSKIAPRTLPHITADFPPSVDLSLFRAPPPTH